ncbi:hypothetical protein QBC38DRAFT_518673 [Podospora fimiseda]|uniref:Uncharacterized protein n=1 Tax=Podospora fimiseda TaxID=252190 RepID=A0AAN7BEC2_9PEZI|nr:hypothetical protein QBC38DRAFT_518673 [Podospora fimiseda]
MNARSFGTDQRLGFIKFNASDHVVKDQAKGVYVTKEGTQTTEDLNGLSSRQEEPAQLNYIPSFYPLKNFTPGKHCFDHKTGIATFQITVHDLDWGNQKKQSRALGQHTFVDLYINDSIYPVWSFDINTFSKGQKPQQTTTAICFVPELDYGEMHFEFRTQSVRNQRSTRQKWERHCAYLIPDYAPMDKQPMPMNSLIRKEQNNKTKLELKSTQTQNGPANLIVSITSSWYPLEMEVPDSERFLIKGILRLDINRATLSLKTTDVLLHVPSMFFLLNDRVFARKTLPHGDYVPPSMPDILGEPVWDDFFEVLIQSRIEDNLCMQICTYDLEKDKWITLGSSKIDLIKGKPWSIQHENFDC